MTLIRSLMIASAGVVLVAAPALPANSPYPLLVNKPGLRVYGPPLRANVPCPSLFSLSHDAPGIARKAVSLSMRPFELRLKLDGRDASVSVRPATRSGFSPAAGGCGRATWRRSLVAFVVLPHIRSASMSQHTFAVGRTRSGWVLWAWIH